MKMALLVIDVQNGMFADPKLPPHNGEALLDRLAALIDRARGAGVPVIFIQHAEDEGPLKPDGGGFAIHSRLAPLEGEAIIVKRRASAFQGTRLEEILRAEGIDTLIITGMQTEFCVDATLRGARERDYRVILVEDGHSTFDTDVLPAERIIAHHNRTLGFLCWPDGRKRADDIRF